MFLAAFLGLTLAIPTANARTVQMFGRYFADTSVIVGDFYQDKNEPITFEISFATGLAGRKFEIICPGQEWDWDKIKKATKAFVHELNNSATIEVFDILNHRGLENCMHKPK